MAVALFIAEIKINCFPRPAHFGRGGGFNPMGSLMPFEGEKGELARFSLMVLAPPAGGDRLLRRPGAA